jgi:hypothetical protein
MLKEEVSDEVKKMDAKYTDERCPFCNSRIDEFGYCACGAAA